MKNEDAPAVNNTNAQPDVNQLGEPLHPSERTTLEIATKKVFVEPRVSVPTNVLEATTFFQAPTIESAST